MRAAALGMVLLCLSQVANAQPAAVTNPKSADAKIFSVPKLLKPQSDGAVNASYNAAWKAYELGVQAATEKLAALMTGQFEEAVEKGDLELAEMWEAQINSLKQNGTVAMAKLPVDAVDAAQRSYEESKAKLKVEYDTLVKEYTKKKNLTRARQLRDEIDNLLKPRDDSPSPVANSIGMKLIEIPAGKFTMGEGVAAVTLTKPFWLGATEVTQGQFKKVMGTEPWLNQDSVQIGEDNAASYVSWDDATAFCQKLTDTDHKSGKLPAGESYRLPTEAEWEYACRAGTTTAFSFGDDKSQLGEYGWFEGNAKNAEQGYAHKVGLKKPNPAGLFDMHGNVWEWCSDWYGRGFSGGTDPVGPGGGSSRVDRGGSWWGLPDFCRSANRSNFIPSFRSNDLGFRVARSQSETPQVSAADRPVQLDDKSKTIGMELIEIPAGQFTMGSPAGEKDHKANEEPVVVTLSKPFLLGKTEVTQGQWQQVMGTEPWKGQDNVQADKDFPATFVSFFDALEFCEKLTDLERKAGKLKAGESYRLPTEAQWEYACRAGTTTTFSFGDDEKQLGEYEWFAGNTAGEQYAHAVGLKKPNPWGLHDMHGNVMEWCSDSYSQKLSGGTNPNTIQSDELKAADERRKDERRKDIEQADRRRKDIEERADERRKDIEKAADERRKQILLERMITGGQAFRTEMRELNNALVRLNNEDRGRLRTDIPLILRNIGNLGNQEQIAIRAKIGEIPGFEAFKDPNQAANKDPNQAANQAGSSRVFRGGGWGYYPDCCRSAYRQYFDPSLRRYDLGFRVARSQSETVAERRQQGSQAEPAPPVAEAKRPVQLEANSIGMKLIVLPAGKFTMGEGGGAVTVTLTKPFLMGRYEVTQGQFKKVMGTSPWVGQSGVQIGEDNAASYVIWNDATAFCQKLTDLERKAGKLKAGESYRLPTEAQWEYACHAGTKTTYSFGDDEEQLGQYAWFAGNTAGEQYAHAFGFKRPNPWGLHDMHGNVWEWCSDRYGDKLSGGTDPVGPEGGSDRVNRGGCWGNDPDSCRSAYRLHDDPFGDGPSLRDGSLGFRVARSQLEQ